MSWGFAAPCVASSKTVPCSAGEAGLVAAVSAANAGGDSVKLEAGCTYTLSSANNTTGGGNALPVITTQGTPWRDLIDHHCGWWEEIGVGPLAQALREATALSDDARCEMGQRGRELVARKYSWSRVASEMQSVYEWLLGQENQPSCVNLS